MVFGWMESARQAKRSLASAESALGSKLDSRSIWHAYWHTCTSCSCGQVHTVLSVETYTLDDSDALWKLLVRNSFGVEVIRYILSSLRRILYTEPSAEGTFGINVCVVKEYPFHPKGTCTAPTFLVRKGVDERLAIGL